MFFLNSRGLAFAIVVGLLIAAAPITAQDATSAPMGTIYLTAASTNDPNAGNKNFVATDVAPTGATSQKAYIATSVMGSGYYTQFDWKATEAFTVTGQFTVKLWISCDVAALYTQGNTQGQTLAQSRAALMKGTTVVTEVTRTDAATACTGPTSIRALEYTGDSKDTEYKVGDALGIRIIFFMTTVNAAQTRNAHLLVNSTAHPSGITAAGIPTTLTAPEEPIEGAVLTYKNETVTGATAKINESFENTTTAIHTYNWTTDGSEFVISTSSEISNGSVDVEFMDGAGKRVYNATLSSANNTSGDDFTPPVLVEGAGGNWTIRLAFADFVGKVAVTVGVAPPAAADATPSNETAAPASQGEGGGIPGVPVGVFALALVAAIIVARRRRA